MKKITMLLVLGAASAAAAHAGSYNVRQGVECPLVSSGQLAEAVQQAGRTTGLDLPRDMVLRTELRCTADGKRFLYAFRASIEKQVADGEQLRWAPVADLTAYGSAAGSSALLRQVRFTVRDLVRQEP
jgi:hypothetical protein